eukprot:scaffold4061_cov108-Cylindrotheca_fusiformis.AAC.12
MDCGTWRPNMLAKKAFAANCTQWKGHLPWGGCIVAIGSVGVDQNKAGGHGIYYNQPIMGKNPSRSCALDSPSPEKQIESAKNRRTMISLLGYGLEERNKGDGLRRRIQRHIGEIHGQ